MTLRILPSALLLLLMVAQAARAAVVFKSVETTFHGGRLEDLAKTIDGVDGGSIGWHVAPKIDQNQAAIFRIETPPEGNLFQFTLYFFSGRPNNAIAEFALSATDDPKPTLGGKWVPLSVMRFNATNAVLHEAPGGRLHAAEVPNQVTGAIKDIIYTVTASTALRGVTAFRLEAFPVRRENNEFGPMMSWGLDGDFVLTEFRVEELRGTTNVALSARVAASHEVPDIQTAAALTDGLPSTFAHPEAPEASPAFFFEIDLGRSYALDHLSLLGRNDGLGFENRLSRLRVQLYEQRPNDRPPVWEAVDRADGSFPQAGEVDVLRAANGTGVFRGRYLRLSTTSTVPRSPQLAEVEAYETRTPQLVAALADGREISTAPVTVPAGTRRLSLVTKIPQSGLPSGPVLRWRLRGFDKTWKTSHELTLDLPLPPAGSYAFEAQAAHSDGVWDATLLALPVKVLAPFTQTPTFRWLAAAALLTAGGLIALVFTRRRVLALKAQTALAAERSRIARDMHDEVGARLSQLAMLQDIFAREHALPGTAEEDLRQLAAKTQEAVTSLDEVVWTVNPENDTLASMAEFLAHHASNYLEPAHISCRIEAPVEWPPIEVRAQLRHELVFAFKEALQNVVKHAQASEVAISLRLTAGNFIATLADNGRGLPEFTGGAGRDGLANMRTRLASVGGTCEISNRDNGGAEVTMRVPLFQ